MIKCQCALIKYNWKATTTSTMELRVSLLFKITKNKKIHRNLWYSQWHHEHCEVSVKHINRTHWFVHREKSIGLTELDLIIRGGGNYKISMLTSREAFLHRKNVSMWNYP